MRSIPVPIRHPDAAKFLPRKRYTYLYNDNEMNLNTLQTPTTLLQNPYAHMKKDTLSEGTQHGSQNAVEAPKKGLPPNSRSGVITWSIH
jgi:hypothetical protein